MVCYMDSVARMLGNTAKHYIIACAYSQAPHNSRERQEDSRLRLSSASVCRSEASRHVVQGRVWVIYGPSSESTANIRGSRCLH